MSRRARNVPLLVLLAAACACSSAPVGGAADGSWVGTVATEGDVTTVVNQSGSVWGGAARLIEEASIGVEAGDEPYMLASIAAIAATDERIYLLEQQPPTVRVYDMNGTWLMDIAREGQGPGELAGAPSMAVRPDGKLLVRADGNGRMNVYSLDGEFLEDWPLPGGYFTSIPMVMMADGTVYTRLPVGDADQTGTPRRGMVPFGIDGTQAGEPIFVPEGEALLTLGEVSGTSSSGRRIWRTLDVPFSPRTTTALSPAGALVIGTGEDYRFEVRRFDGTTLAVQRVAAPVPVDSDEAAWNRRYITAQARDLDPSWSWSGPDIPATKRYFNGFYADESGRIWVRRPGPGRHLTDCDENPSPGLPGSMKRCWQDSEIIDVFGADGRYLGPIDLPEGTSLRAGRSVIRDDLVLLPFEDEAGTVMVKRYRIVLPHDEGP